MVRESWQGGCRGNADSQGAKYNSTPSYKNREHKKDERRQRSWRKPRRGRRRGRRGASTNSSRVEHVHTVPCLALGMGKGLPQPQARLRVPRREGRKAGSTGANRLNCPSTPVDTEPRGHGSGCSLSPGEFMLPPGTAHSPEGVALSQRFVPPSSQASSTGQRRRQTQALQRANTGDLHISQKHESEPVVHRPRLLTPSRPLNVSQS